jgi:hypothetical protein
MIHVPESNFLLRARAREVISYLRFLRVVVEQKATLTAQTTTSTLQVVIPRSLTYTLKANVYLLLYSVMEATFVQLIDEIHKCVEQNASSVDHLQSDLLLHITRTFKASKTDVVHSNMQAPIGEALMVLWRNEWKNKTKGKERRTGGISGNIDGRAMHQLLLKYGAVQRASDDPMPHLTHKALESAKDRRNMLAHGELGFSDLGRGISVDELFTDARDVFKTLVRIALHVNGYLGAKGYLTNSTWQADQK